MTDVVRITPKLAEEYLATMTSNRPLTDGKVIEYAIEIESGKWIVNGETIKFNKKGELIDGQHRLRACILAGKPFTSHVVKDIDDARAFATIDVGKVRTAADMFSLDGIALGNEGAAVANLLYHYKHDKINWTGLRPFNFKMTTKMSGGLVKRTSLSKADLIAWSRQYVKKIDSAILSCRAYKVGRLLQMSTAAAAYVLFAEKDADEANQFISDFGTGAELKDTDSVYWLRERMIENKAGKARLHRYFMFGLMLKAWNKRREGARTRTLKIVPGEAFPKVV